MSKSGIDFVSIFNPRDTFAQPRWLHFEVKYVRDLLFNTLALLQLI